MDKILLFTFFMGLLACQNPTISEADSRQAIINTLDQETQYFCERNLEKWQTQWAHQPYCSKMYAGATDFEELLGWEAIRQFAVDHIAKNPEVLPLPQAPDDYEIYLLGETALVYFTKRVGQATMRESRLMVKEDGQWKIARMQTTY